ncbi:Hypothetical_protein [Hexamita inflata]|nr:Hypothetical protein HINF_LOCUS35756 [Hexamita inflata]CAI9948122.1 Hypothetical protein HINF_LOCUS35767 [Hexamita inflata]
MRISALYQHPMIFSIYPRVNLGPNCMPDYIKILHQNEAFAFPEIYPSNGLLTLTSAADIIFQEYTSYLKLGKQTLMYRYLINCDVSKISQNQSVTSLVQTYLTAFSSLMSTEYNLYQQNFTEILLRSV